MSSRARQVRGRRRPNGRSGGVTSREDYSSIGALVIVEEAVESRASEDKEILDLVAEEMLPELQN